MAVLVGVDTVPLAVIATEQMDELNSRFELIMGDTMAYLDQAWEVAKRFRDPDYDFKPSDLGNFTIPEI